MQSFAKDGEREPVDLSSGGRPNAFCRAAGHWSMMDRVNRPQMTRKSRENHEAGPQEIATEDSGIHSDCLLPTFYHLASAAVVSFVPLV